MFIKEVVHYGPLILEKKIKKTFKLPRSQGERDKIIKMMEECGINYASAVAIIQKKKR